MEELAEMVLNRGIFALAVQETWRTGNCQIESRGVLFIGHGFEEARCRRGSGGVGLLLGPAGRKAWETAGSEVHYFGERILAVRLQILDERRRVVKLWLVSAYSPDSSYPADVREAFRVELGQCFEATRAGEVPVVSIDANASMGRREEGVETRVLGPFGLRHRNRAGEELLAEHEMCSTTSFFQKSRYGTWVHPCSRNDKGRRWD